MPRVVRGGGTVVGASVLLPAAPISSLASIAVHPAWRRRGLGVALLDDALAWFEVRTTAVYDGGDHSIVVGEVVALSLAEEPPAALTFFRGQYGHLD